MQRTRNRPLITSYTGPLENGTIRDLLRESHCQSTVADEMPVIGHQLVGELTTEDPPSLVTRADAGAIILNA